MKKIKAQLAYTEDSLMGKGYVVFTSEDTSTLFDENGVFSSGSRVYLLAREFEMEVTKEEQEAVEGKWKALSDSMKEDRIKWLESQIDELKESND